MSYDASDPAAQDSALLPSERQTLNEAGRLLATGKPGQAAPLFAKLAEVLTSARQPQRAANLHAESARAFAKSRNEAGALTQARQALNLFLQYKLTERATLLYADLSHELTKRKMEYAAATLVKEFASRVPQPESKSSSTASRLPANCPQCGAPVHLSDAQLAEAGMVECPYCGTPIRPTA